MAEGEPGARPRVEHGRRDDPPAELWLRGPDGEAAFAPSGGFWATAFPGPLARRLAAGLRRAGRLGGALGTDPLLRQSDPVPLPAPGRRRTLRAPRPDPPAAAGRRPGALPRDRARPSLAARARLVRRRRPARQRLDRQPRADRPERRLPVPVPLRGDLHAQRPAARLRDGRLQRRSRADAVRRRHPPLRPAAARRRRRRRRPGRDVRRRRRGPLRRARPLGRARAGPGRGRPARRPASSATCSGSTTPATGRPST